MTSLNKTADMQYLSDLCWKSKGAAIDSRPEHQPGGLKGKVFFALKGTHSDGNDHAIDAIKAGAIAAIIDHPKIIESARKSPSMREFVPRLHLVDDALVALQELGRMHRARFKIPVLGITGTNGKTTTKELLAVALEQKYGKAGVLSNAGNLNNHIGVPLTLLRMTDKTKVAVIEMGANKPGDIRELCDIADPTHALVTNMGIAHIEGFGSKAGVIRTKSELYEYVNAHAGTIFVNGTDPILMSALGKVLSKKKKGTDACAEKSAHIVEYGDKDLIGKNANNAYLIGSYNRANMNAAKAIARALKVPSRLIDAAISGYVPRNMRSQRIVSATTKNRIFLDAYNANPSSMPLAIDAYLTEVHSHGSLAGMPVLILGEMRELGKESAKDHARILKIASVLAKAKKADIALVGEEFHAAWQKAGGNGLVHAWRTKEDFVKSDMYADLARPHRRADIFIKGSRGMKLEELVGGL